MGAYRTKADLLPGTLDMLVLKYYCEAICMGMPSHSSSSNYPTTSCELKRVRFTRLCSVSN
jgi:hypothetical protein